jgi:hypothetical protein
MFMRCVNQEIIRTRYRRKFRPHEGAERTNAFWELELSRKDKHIHNDERFCIQGPLGRDDQTGEQHRMKHVIGWNSSLCAKEEALSRCRRLQA